MKEGEVAMGKDIDNIVFGYCKFADAGLFLSPFPFFPGGRYRAKLLGDSFVK